MSVIQLTFNEDPHVRDFARHHIQNERTRWLTSVDSLYPLLILLVYAPQAVSCVPGSADGDWIARLLLVTIGLSCFYTVLFFVAAHLMYHPFRYDHSYQELVGLWMRKRDIRIFLTNVSVVVSGADVALLIWQNYCLWRSLYDHSSLQAVLPMITTTVLATLSVLLAAIKSTPTLEELWSGFRAWLKSDERNMHNQYAKRTYEAAWTEAVSEWRMLDEARNFGTDLRVGLHCHIKEVIVRVEQSGEGSITYQAKTERTWTGDYFHIWLSWLSRSDGRVLAEIPLTDKEGVLPVDVITSVMKSNGGWKDFRCTFRIIDQNSAALLDRLIHDATLRITVAA